MANEIVFPAQAGVNLRTKSTAFRKHCIPRASGGEPKLNEVLAKEFGVFPAQAGVNPTCAPAIDPIVRIPRASGGEPTFGQYTDSLEKYSPRKRG